MATALLVTVMLTLGAGTASATRLCTTSSCAALEAYPAETALAAALKEGTQAKLLTNVANVECKSASIAGKTTKEAGEPLPLEVSELSFAECEREGEEACTTTTISLPTAAGFEASGEGNGTLSLEGGVVKFECGFYIKCELPMPVLQAKGGAPAHLVAEEVKLAEGKGFACPETSKFDATYTVSKPEPAYTVASEGQTRLCTTSSCAALEAYPAETALAASLEDGTQAKLLTSLGNVECKSASIAGKTTKEAGKPLPLEVSELAFAECELKGETECTATTESLPTSPSFEASGEGNGTLSLEGGEVRFKCGFLLNCLYQMPTLQVKGGAPASLVAEEVEMTGEGFACPETSKLDATYTVSKPLPAYVGK